MKGLTFAVVSSLALLAAHGSVGVGGGKEGVAATAASAPEWCGVKGCRKVSCKSPKDDTSKCGTKESCPPGYCISKLGTNDSCPVGHCIAPKRVGLSKGDPCCCRRGERSAPGVAGQGGCGCHGCESCRHRRGKD
jgi:hypothetical protein